MRRSRSPVRFSRERSIEERPVSPERSFSTSSCSCSRGQSYLNKRHSVNDNNRDTRSKTRDKNEHRDNQRKQIGDHGDRHRHHSRSKHHHSDRKSENSYGTRKHEVLNTEENLDPSICDFQVEGTYQSVKKLSVSESLDLDQDKNPVERTTEKLEQLEKMIEKLVKTKGLQPEPSSSVASTEASENPYELNPRNSSFTTSMWMNKINGECMLKNFDEITCIDYMQSRTSGLMKSWFKTLNIFSYTWPELQMLVFRTFPDNVDYATTLRLLVNRSKMFDETFAQYYFSKMYLLEACRITGVNAVSCLIDGLNDPYLQQEARVQNFLSPETFYSQFLAKLSDYENPMTRKETENNRNQHDIHVVEEPVLVENVDKRFDRRFDQKQLITGPQPRKQKKKWDMKCFMCGELGHMQADCRFAPHCFGCLQPGHILAKCPLRAG